MNSQRPIPADDGHVGRTQTQLRLVLKLNPWYSAHHDAKQFIPVDALWRRQIQSV